MSEAVPPPPAIVVTQDERTMALLAHVLQIPGTWIAPLIIFFVKRDSRFVKFHALQALILQVCILLLWIAVFVVSIVVSVAASGGAHQDKPPMFLFAMFPVFWLLVFGGWVLVLIIGIVYGIKASQGEWASYPLIGRLARHFLKM